MKAQNEKVVEALIRDSAFRNPAHKNKLRDRLFEKAVPLCPEDLEGVAGGVTLPDPDAWTAWPEKQEKK